MSAPYPWLPLHLRRQRDPRLALAAKQLRKRAAELYGYIVFAMGAAAEHYQDGVFRAGGAHTPEQVFDAAAGWAGKASLAQALIAHGLLLVVEGGLMLEGWAEEQAGQIAKFERDRAASAARRSKDSPKTVAEPSADGRKTVARRSQDGRAVEGEGEREEEKEEAAAPAREAGPREQEPQPTRHIGNPTAPPAALTSDEQVLLAAWNGAAEANGRPVATTLPATLRMHARSQIKTHGLEAITRAFQLVCGYAPLWEPGGRGWVASLGWVLKTADVVDRARAGTYGPWTPHDSRATPARRSCDRCAAPAHGEVWGAMLCLEHGRQATEHPEGPRAWVQGVRS